MIQPPDYPSFFSWCLRNPVEQSLTVSPQRHPWEPDRLHASDLGAALPPEDGGCMRRTWLRIHGYPTRQHTDGEALMLFKGQLIHELLANWMEHRLHLRYPEWKVVAVEEALPDMEGGVGRLDVRVEHLPTRERHVVDFKSVRGSAFEYRSFPYASHLYQVSAYIRSTGDEFFVIVYTDREGQNFMKQTGPHPRMDAEVLAAWGQLRQLKTLPQPPACVPPVAILAKRKTTGDAVSLDVPFQCGYCKARDVSCPTALSPVWRGRVVGHLADLVEGADDPCLAIYEGKILALKPEAESAGLRLVAEKAVAKALAGRAESEKTVVEEGQ